MNKIAIAFCLLTLGVTFASADTMPMNASGLKWGPAPSVFPKGAQVAVLSGDPFKDGPYVLRLKMPKGYKVPAHNHPTTENVTVISGNFHMAWATNSTKKMVLSCVPEAMERLLRR